jgi:hypothetical protein
VGKRNERIEQILAVDIVKALVKGTRTYSVFSRVLKRPFRLFRRQGLEFGANRFEFRNETWKLGDAPFSVAIGMLHEDGEVVRRKVSGNRIPKTTEIAVMAKLPAGDLVATIPVTEYAKVEAHV